jgi:hypothetical protein
MGPNELLLSVALLLILTPLAAQTNARIANRGYADGAEYEDADIIEEDDFSPVALFGAQGKEPPSRPIRSVVRGLQ